MQIPPPAEMLVSVPVAPVDNVSFHSLATYSNLEGVIPKDVPSQVPSMFDLKVLPVKMHLDDINSNFVEVRIAILFLST